MNESAGHTSTGPTRASTGPTHANTVRTSEVGFCVLGLHSTPLVPGEAPRIVELALIQVDAQGETQNRWHTVVNPQRALGPGGVRGLSDDDLGGAPTFAQLAARVSTRLAGRVVVAHNARFVFDLLADELSRAGLPAPAAVQPVCTMQLARDLLPGAGRSLADCGAAYGLVAVPPPVWPLGSSAGSTTVADLCDSALTTATATTALLRAYLQSAGCLDAWTDALEQAGQLPWPVPAARGGVPRTRPRTAAAQRSTTIGPALLEPRFSTRAPLRLPDFTGPDEQLDYLALLDRCLVDGTLLMHAPTHPLSLLTEHARRTHITAATRTRLHHSYAEQLLRVALADGALTPLDRAELFTVSRMLGVDPAEDLVEDRVVSALPERLHSPGGTPPVLKRGDTIVLTESLMRGTAVWAREIVARGFTVAAAVTLRTRLVVAADPTMVSGKTVKAHDYGIPIVSEFALRSAMGID